MNWNVVGLGNPGGEFSNTRHNAGFICIDAVKDQYHSTDWKKTLLTKTVYAMCEILDSEVRLIKPQTYMNLSGRSVKKYIKSKDDLARLIVLHDDIHLKMGTLKISFGKGDAGHNGITSLFEALHSKDFLRIRIGIAPELQSGNGLKLDQYVLGKFTKGELDSLKETSRRVASAIEAIMKDGKEKAMNIYNT